MSVRLPIATLILALAAWPCAAGDKPADLPQEVQIQCAVKPLTAFVQPGPEVHHVFVQVAESNAPNVHLWLDVWTDRTLFLAEQDCFIGVAAQGSCENRSCCEGCQKDTETGCATHTGCKGCQKDAGTGCATHTGCEACCESGCCHEDAACPCCAVWVTSTCPMCASLAKLCSMCPMMNGNFAHVCKPCLSGIAAGFRQMFVASTDEPADDEASEPAPEPDAKKHGCGGCGNSSGTGTQSGGCSACPTAVGQWHCMGECAGTAVEVEQLSVMPEETTPSKPVQSQCPYLKQKAAQENTPPAAACPMPGSPLENLAKLRKAQRIFTRGEQHYEAGEYDQADHCYAKVMKLCPGSRWDAQAQTCRHLVAVMKMMSEAAHATAEEAQPVQEKPLPCEPSADGMAQFSERLADLLEQARCALEGGCTDEAQRLAQDAANLPMPVNCARVAELIEAAQRCFAAGCHDEAWDLVHQALMLDPNCAAAQYLQTKLIEDRGEPQGRSNPAEDEGADETCEPPDDGPAGLGFRHVLPMTDRNVVEALDQLEKCAGHVEQDASEEQEQPLQIDPQDEELELQPADCGGLARDMSAMQQAFNAEVLKWIESMNSGGNLQDAGDSEECEEPYYELETDLDPEW